jgi:hypothetical protein
MFTIIKGHIIRINKPIFLKILYFKQNELALIQNKNTHYVQY